MNLNGWTLGKYTNKPCVVSQTREASDPAAPGQLDRVGDLLRSRAPAAWIVPKLCRKLCLELCRMLEEAHKKVCKDAGKTAQEALKAVLRLTDEPVDKARDKARVCG